MALENWPEKEDGEILFPLDAADYTRAMNRQLARIGYTAVYVVSTKDCWPTKIGVTSDIHTRLDQMQRGNWNELYLYYVLWFPDKGIASVVAGAVEMLLIQRRTSRGWFTVKATQARRAILDSAARVYPGVKLFEHTEMMRLLHSKTSARFTTSL